MNTLLIIIKNYLKLIVRNKVMLIVVVLGTLLVVAALSNAFHTLLDSAEDVDEFLIGYSITEDSKYTLVEEQLVEAFKDEDISVEKYTDKEPMSLVEMGQVDAFVEFTDDSYHIYGDSKKEIQARTVQYVLFNVDAQLETYMAGGLKVVELQSEELETVETSEAENYYGIIENVYFIGLCSIFLCLIFQTERKNNIGIRFKVGNANCVVRYLSKLISCVIIAVIFQIGVALGLVTLLFDVTIGVPVVSIGLMILETIAFAAFGLILLTLFENMAVSIGFLFMVLWISGFTGGTFETYMYSMVPENIRLFSPLYYVNRSIVELSVLGESSYVTPCIYYMLAMIAVCVPVGIVLTAKKKEV